MIEPGSEVAKALADYVAAAGQRTQDALMRAINNRAEINRLRAALTDARDALRNDFEPNNQSRAWHRANDALNLNGIGPP